MPIMSPSAHPLYFGRLPGAPSIMNGIVLPKIGQLPQKKIDKCEMLWYLCEIEVK
jgi:hypothetical protein